MEHLPGYGGCDHEPGGEDDGHSPSTLASMVGKGVHWVDSEESLSSNELPGWVFGNAMYILDLDNRS